MFEYFSVWDISAAQMRVFISLIVIPNLALVLVFFFSLECSYLCLCTFGLNLMLSMLHVYIRDGHAPKFADAH